MRKNSIRIEQLIFAQNNCVHSILWIILAQATLSIKNSIWNFKIIKENAVGLSLVTKLQDL